jgi:hypothetical protein
MPTAQPANQPFPELLARFNRPGLRASQIFSLANELVNEVAEVRKDVLAGDLDPSRVDARDRRHLDDATAWTSERIEAAIVLLRGVQECLPSIHETPRTVF